MSLDPSLAIELGVDVNAEARLVGECLRGLRRQLVRPSPRHGVFRVVGDVNALRKGLRENGPVGVDVGAQVSVEALYAVPARRGVGPWGRTASCCGFDRPAGLFLLKAVGARVSES